MRVPFFSYPRWEELSKFTIFTDKMFSRRQLFYRKTCERRATNITLCTQTIAVLMRKSPVTMIVRVYFMSRTIEDKIECGEKNYTQVTTEISILHGYIYL